MILITGLAQPATGAVVAQYCKFCRRTEIAWAAYALKPTDGDFWVVYMPCPEHCFYNEIFDLPLPTSARVNGAPL